MTGYVVNDIFGPTLQGEGLMAGNPCVFLRFAHCNLRCAQEPGERSIGGFDCDTEFESGHRMTLQEIIDRLRAIRNGVEWVVISGGEPAIQVDAELLNALHLNNFKVAIETNGTFDLSGLHIDWITCSPKVAEHAVKCLNANEVKYVRNVGQGIPKPACQAPYQFISPASKGDKIDPEAVAWCLKLVLENPGWRMTWQAHKLWRVQ